MVKGKKISFPSFALLFFSCPPRQEKQNETMDWISFPPALPHSRDVKRFRKRKKERSNGGWVLWCKSSYSPQLYGFRELTAKDPGICCHNWHQRKIFFSLPLNSWPGQKPSWSAVITSFVVVVEKNGSL